MTRTTPTPAMMPDFGAMIDLWSKQTNAAITVNSQMMQVAMEAWVELPLSMSRAMMPVPTAKPSTMATTTTKPAQKTTVKSSRPQVAAKPVEKAEAKPVAETSAAPVGKAEAKATVAKAPVAKAKAPEVKVEAPAKPAPKAPAKTAPASAKPAAAHAPVKTEPAPKPAPKPAETKAEAASGPQKPKGLAKPRKSGAEDLTVLKGVGPKLAQELGAMGVFHLDQVAKWRKSNIAWLDENLPGPKGLVTRNNLVAQAADLLAKTASKPANGVDKPATKG